MKVIAEFNDKKGFNVKLTKDKVYVSTIGNEETFALRSVNGVGLYDDINKYNSDLESYKRMNDNSTIILILKIISFILFLYPIYYLIAFDGGRIGDMVTMIFIGIIFYGLAIYFKKQKPSGKKPKLDSYFKLMLSGGAREFLFDKSDENSGEIADFINKLEDTLTSYK